jgi:hypothetical protein
MRAVASVDEWAKRGAAVVWYGFTRMATCADNAAVIVERPGGRELIDVDATCQAARLNDRG